MPTFIKQSLIAAMLLLGSFAVPNPALAQTITLGGDDEQIFRVLRDNGFTNPKVTQRGLTIIRTEACKGADLYRVKVSILGRITSASKVGECPVVAPTRFSRKDATKLLEREGYDRIEASRNGPLVIATACRDNKKTQFSFNRRGRVTERQDLGACVAEGMSREQIAQVLRRDGYKRIVVTDAELPRYRAEACRGTERVRVDMDRRGVVRSERRIGECGQQLDPNTIAEHIKKQGFTRVQVIDRRRPPYIAHACRGNDKMELTIGRFGRLQQEKRIGPCRQPIDPANLANLLKERKYNRIQILRGNRTPYLVEACKSRVLVELTVNRFGRITKEDQVGRCAAPVTEKSLNAKLTKLNYLNVTIKRRGAGWSAEGCLDEVKRSLRIDAFGEIQRDRKTGVCKSNSVLDILKTLETRGAESTALFVEGCYRGKKYRWQFDRLGNRTGRSSIGGC